MICPYQCMYNYSNIEGLRALLSYVKFQANLLFCSKVSTFSLDREHRSVLFMPSFQGKQGQTVKSLSHSEKEKFRNEWNNRCFLKVKKQRAMFFE